MGQNYQIIFLKDFYQSIFIKNPLQIIYQVGRRGREAGDENFLENPMVFNEKEGLG